MKINDTSVTGVFAYSDDAIFEENDFVIYNGIMYVCLPEEGRSEVSGEKPGISRNYTSYLGNKAVTLREYLDFLETGEGENLYLSTTLREEGREGKFITKFTLQEMLNKFMMGPDGKGIIGEYVQYDGDQVSVSPGLGTYTSDPNSILADIMKNEEINHAMLRVSRSLPEIYIYVGGPLNTSSVTTTDLTSCILKQYTYLSESSGHRIRVQELIDPVDGLIFFRSGDLDGDEINSSIEFRGAIVNTKVLKRKADEIFSLYNARLKVIKSLEDHLKSNFRYRRLDISGHPTTYICPGLSQTLPEITLMMTEYDGETRIRRNYETTIDPSSGWDTYGIGNTYKVLVTPDSNDIILSLKNLNGSDPSSDVAWISGVYYREYYDL